MGGGIKRNGARERERVSARDVHSRISVEALALLAKFSVAQSSRGMTPQEFLQPSAVSS